METGGPESMREGWGITLITTRAVATGQDMSGKWPSDGLQVEGIETDLGAEVQDLHVQLHSSGTA